MRNRKYLRAGDETPAESNCVVVGVVESVVVDNHPSHFQAGPPWVALRSIFLTCSCRVHPPANAIGTNPRMSPAKLIKAGRPVLAAIVFKLPQPTVVHFYQITTTGCTLHLKQRNTTPAPFAPFPCAMSIFTNQIQPVGLSTYLLR